MPTYNVSLARAFLVEIEAENERAARELTEFFVGGTRDLSNDRDRAKYKFEILEIELTLNDAVDAELVEESNE